MKEFGLKRVKFLPASGTFHTKLMRPAAKRFEEALNSVKFRRPAITVHSNVHIMYISTVHYYHIIQHIIK